MAHQWRGDFQFNISRCCQQLMETSHRHLLHAEEGTWLNIDGFHMGIGGDDSWSPSVSAEFQRSTGSYHYQLLLCCIINWAGHVSARISRKEIHYVLFKNTNFWMSGLFFFFYFFIMEPTSRFS